MDATNENTYAPVKTISVKEFPAAIRKKALEEKNVYCIVDGAADETLYPLLKNSDWNYLCLYKQGIHFEGERMTDSLAATAPYLLHLDPDKLTVEQFVRMRTGRHQMIVLQSESFLADLAHHFSGMLKAMDEDGKIFNFRYYDPRVLRVYLPTCTEEEKHIFYGPADTFWAEGEENDVLEFPRQKVETAEEEIIEKAEEPPKEESSGYGLFGKQAGAKSPDSDTITGYGVAGDF
jgi:hypothetical protein